VFVEIVVSVDSCQKKLQAQRDLREPPIPVGIPQTPSSNGILLNPDERHYPGPPSLPH